MDARVTCCQREQHTGQRRLSRGRGGKRRPPLADGGVGDSQCTGAKPLAASSCPCASQDSDHVASKLRAAGDVATDTHVGRGAAGLGWCHV